MDYDKNSKDYKGQTFDCANHLVDVFADGTEIHAVYHLGEDNQYFAKEDISSVIKDPDKYLFTPYIEFV